jgi:hypothetical protein
MMFIKHDDPNETNGIPPVPAGTMASRMGFTDVRKKTDMAANVPLLSSPLNNLRPLTVKDSYGIQ